MSYFNQPIFIGNLEVKNRVFLAPLAGVSDVPFRRICQEYGAGLTYVEMLSANAINYRSHRTLQMMRRHPSESILGVQLTGPSAELVAQAAEFLDKQGFDTIDINMGCPVKKIVNNASGSAILKDPQRVWQTVKAVKAVSSRPISAKIRLGFTREGINVLKNSQQVAEAQAAMLTIHGRTRSENYSHPVDYDNLAKGLKTAKEKISIVTVGNGNVFEHISANKMRAETNCDAIMVSRGALGNPWIFQEILEQRRVEPTLEEWLDVVLRHLSYQKEHYEIKKVAVGLMKKLLVWYAKGFPSCKYLRDQVKSISSLEEAEEIFRSYAAKLPSDLPRHFFHDEEERELRQNYDPKYEMDRKLDRGVGDDCLQK